MKYSLLIILCAVFSLWSPSLSAELIAVDADAYIQNGSNATTKYGTSDLLLIKHNSEGNNYDRKTYIRFDLGTLSFDHTSLLGSVSLNLNFVDSGLGDSTDSIEWTFGVWGLNDGDTAESWGEETTTWNNAPQNNTGSDFEFGTGATKLGTFTFTGKTATVNFTSTSLNDFVAGSTSDDLLTFMIGRDTDQSGSNTYVHSIAAGEHATITGPQLDLIVIPEISTFSLVLLASVVSLAGLRLQGRDR
ncbi:DNRLRE domain-containing protein [Kiritimatiellaeota bacterium B1221]|nr:DNRLRE domain-containing protein [Kiritimatiellaeota bacterium B1221]